MPLVVIASDREAGAKQSMWIKNEKRFIGTWIASSAKYGNDRPPRNGNMKKSLPSEEVMKEACKASDLL